MQPSCSFDGKLEDLLRGRLAIQENSAHTATEITTVMARRGKEERCCTLPADLKKPLTCPSKRGEEECHGLIFIYQEDFALWWKDLNATKAVE